MSAYRSFLPVLWRDPKQALTFTDAIGTVRFALWVGDIYRHSPTHPESPEIPPHRLKRMAEALCFAA